MGVPRSGKLSSEWEPARSLSKVIIPGFSKLIKTFLVSFADRPKAPYLLIDSRRLDAGNIFIPVKENSELSLACVSEGGNPKPVLSWEILLSPGVDRHAQKISHELTHLEEVKKEGAVSVNIIYSAKITMVIYKAECKWYSGTHSPLVDGGKEWSGVTSNLWRTVSLQAQQHPVRVVVVVLLCGQKQIETFHGTCSSRFPLMMPKSIIISII